MKINLESELARQIMDYLGTIIVTGQIVYFKDDVEVGRIELPSFTTEHVRHLLARMARVKEYDNFHLLNEDGTLKVNAREVFIDGLLLSGLDTRENRGVVEGRNYTHYLNNINTTFCMNCHQRIGK